MILPCVYAALPNKKAETYVEMLNAIKTILKPFGDLVSLPYLPETALTDFEMAIQNAFRDCFPLIRIKGCYFHFKSFTSKLDIKAYFKENLSI